MAIVANLADIKKRENVLNLRLGLDKIMVSTIALGSNPGPGINFFH